VRIPYIFLLSKTTAKFIIRCNYFGLVGKKLKAKIPGREGIRMPVLSFRYDAYVEVKVSRKMYDLIINGKVEFGNKWGNLIYKGVDGTDVMIQGEYRDVDYKRAEDEEWLEIDDADDADEDWCEKCLECDTWLGGKIFTDEKEFDNHPDRLDGYNEDGDWLCSEHRCAKPEIFEPIPVPKRGCAGSPKPQTPQNVIMTRQKKKDSLLLFPFPQIPTTPTMDELKECEICFGDAGKYGCNPEPLPYKVCCNKCDEMRVLPCRLEICRKISHINKSCVHSESVKAMMRSQVLEETIAKYKSSPLGLYKDP